MDLDRIDIAILRALCADGRVTHVELSERVGLTSTACARRIEKLEQGGVIEGYQAVLGLRELGLTNTVMVRIALDSQSEEAFQDFEAAVAASASVLRCHLMSGTDDYVLTVLARSIEDFERIHRTELSRLPRVARLQSSFAMREIVNRSYPAAALERTGIGAGPKSPSGLG